MKKDKQKTENPTISLFNIFKQTLYTSERKTKRKLSVKKYGYGKIKMSDPDPLCMEL